MSDTRITALEAQLAESNRQRDEARGQVSACVGRLQVLRAFEAPGNEVEKLAPDLYRRWMNADEYDGGKVIVDYIDSVIANLASSAEAYRAEIEKEAYADALQAVRSVIFGGEFKTKAGSEFVTGVSKLATELKKRISEECRKKP